MVSNMGAKCVSGRSSDRCMLDAVVSSMKKGTHYCVGYLAIIDAVNYLLFRASQKHSLHAYSFGGGLSVACLMHLWCAVPTTNCRKNELPSWFAGTGRCSVLCTDVNDAAQIRQEGVPCLPSIHLPSSMTMRTYAHVAAVHVDYIPYGAVIQYYCTIESSALLPDPLSWGRVWV